jgi:ABC-type transport system involved in multi-copper enzyme maturation permease subunit
MADPAPPAVAPPRAPSFVEASLRVFDLTLGQMLWSRRTIFLALVVGAPVALAALFKALEAAGLAGIRVSGTRVAGPMVFGIFIWVLYLRFIIPVLGVFYGTSLIADEVEEKTITYLFTRPIARAAVLGGKYLAYLVCTVLVVLPSVVLVYLLMVPIRGGGMASSFPSLVIDLGLLGAGLAVYGAFFTLIGAWLKHPLITGLVFAFGWEPGVLMIPGYLRKFTIAYYLQALVPQGMPQEGVASLLQSVFRDVPSTWVCLLSLAVIGIGSLVVAGWVVEKREYVLEQ